ncbi:MAG: diguanylate cyclase [Limnothrix sp.]
MEQFRHFWVNIFSPENYIPHGHCYLWQTPLVWLHVVSDTLIGLAYFSIPICLVYFIRRRQDVPFQRIFKLFSLFIIVCGVTHFLGVWTLWHPAYWLSGTAKMITALVSVYTSIELIPVIPQALSLKSPNDLQQLNEQLQAQIKERAIAEAEILILNRELESRVEERTLTLAETNLQLTQEIEIRRQIQESLKDANSKQAKQLEQLEEYTQVQQCISRLTDTLQICDSLEEAFPVSADLAKKIFSHCRGAIFVIQPPLQVLNCVAAWGFEKNTPSISSFDIRDCWGLRKSTAHISDQDDPSMCCNHIHFESQATALCVPLLVRGEIIGLFHLDSNEEIEPLTCDYAKTVADQLALSFHNLKLKEDLKVQSYLDPLTGLYNRRYLEIYLAKKLPQASINHDAISFILFDVDHFKAVNDQHGHDAGDKVLEYLSRFLTLNVRELDLACRYGGEEILLVLPNSTLEQAYKRADILRAGISRLQIKFAGSILPSITVSAGVASFSEKLNSVDQVLRAVDQALYMAKNQGRNQVVCAADFEEPQLLAAEIMPTREMS